MQIHGIECEFRVVTSQYSGLSGVKVTTPVQDDTKVSLRTVIYDSGVKTYHFGHTPVEGRFDSTRDEPLCGTTKNQ